MASSRGAEDAGRLILRLMVGGLMLFHGIAKLTRGIGWLFPLLSSHGLPPFMAYGIFLAEVVAPVLIILGIATRASALVVAFDMIMAIVLVVRPRFFTLSEGGGGWGIELEALFLLGALALAFLGAGSFSAMRKQSWWN